jgi:hypothetical protein
MWALAQIPNIRQTTQAEDLNDFTMNFSMMSPHVGDDVWLAVIETETMKEVGRVYALGALVFVMEIPGILEDGRSYQVDFYADENKNGHYDPPGTDHAWRMEIMNAQGNETLEFSHQIAFTDVEWKHRLRLALSGMAESVGEKMVMYVREQSTGAYLDTVSLESIPADEFTMDSYVIGNGGTYMLDFYADLNGNGLYDAPPVDQAWRISSVNTTGDRNLEFVHNQDFTDIFQALGAGPEEKIQALSVYPNPASSHLFINMGSGKDNTGSLLVLNAAGSTVLSNNFSASGGVLDLDIGYLPEGVYFLKIDRQSGRSYSRFVKH